MRQENTAPANNKGKLGTTLSLTDFDLDAVRASVAGAVPTKRRERSQGFVRAGSFTRKTENYRRGRILAAVKAGK